jgi:hypothetical protein
VLSGRIGVVTVKGTGADSLALYVNGVLTQYGEMRKDNLYDFTNIRFPRGQVAIVLTARTKTGWRTSDSKTVEVPGNAEELVFENLPEFMIADGKSKGYVSLSVFDERGMISPDPYNLTITVTNGTVLGKDLDEDVPGFQMRTESGKAAFYVVSGNTAGDMLITVSLGSFKKTAKIALESDLRPFIAVGHIGARLGYNETGGINDTMGLDFSEFKKGEYYDGRGAFFAQGGVAQRFLLTVAYDSKVTRRPALLRRTDPEELLPIYGDTGSLFYINRSSTPLFIRAERDASFIEWSDYQADLDTESEFTRYGRNLSGINGRLKTKNLEGGLFFSPYTKELMRPRSQHIVDIITPDGTSGFYSLTNTNIIKGSESVRIERRDRWETDIILSTETMSRLTQYDIDYDEGRILFHSAVLMYDALRNPYLIIVEYEAESQDGDDMTGGARALFKTNDELLGLGITGIYTGSDLSEYTLFGSDLTLTFGEMARIRAEAAMSNSEYDTLTSIDGMAYKAEGRLDTKVFKGLLYYKSVEEGFTNISSTTAINGMNKAGGNLGIYYEDWTAVFWLSELVHDEYGRTRAAIEASRKISAFTLSLGGEYWLYDNAGEKTDISKLNTRLDYRATERLNLNIRHSQVFEADLLNPHESAIGAEYALKGGHSLTGSLGLWSFPKRIPQRAIQGFGRISV